MPTVPIYVRKEDYKVFLEIYSPEWLHQQLKLSSTKIMRTPPMSQVIKENAKAIKTSVSHSDTSIKVTKPYYTPPESAL